MHNRKRTAIAAAAAAFALLAFASPAYADTDPATGEEVVTEAESDNSITFCGFASGDISDEELAELGVDETWDITYMTQQECDDETTAALADASASPDPEPEPTDTAEPEPTEPEATTDDEVVVIVPVDEDEAWFSDSRALYLGIG